MNVSDPIGDMLTRIRNAQMRGKSTTSTPASKLRGWVLDVLKEEGYIRGYDKMDDENGKPQFSISLKYFEGRPVIRELSRVSKPKVTLRRARMYDFLDRLITVAMPRIRDFRGVKHTSFDGRGNYALGLKEHIIFPEIDYDKVDHVRGMDIIICTTAKSDAEAKALLTHFNMPFAQQGQ